MDQSDNSDQSVRLFMEQSHEASKPDLPSQTLFSLFGVLSATQAACCIAVAVEAFKLLCIAHHTILLTVTCRLCLHTMLHLLRLL